MGPFVSRRVEGNLEVFLFLMGLISASVAGAWSLHLLEEGFIAPIKITLAVLGAGILFHYLRKHIDSGMAFLLKRVPLAATLFIIIFTLGFLSSLISAIIAALILVEFVGVLRLHRRAEVTFTVIACFAIGFGAALTPLGEPLSTIAISQLSGEPYRAGFLFLAELLATYVVPVVVLLAVLGALLVRRSAKDTGATLSDTDARESMRDVVMRAVKVYVFVMALIFLGAGFKVVVEMYLLEIPSLVLYWINTSSAVLDNATLAAAEIGPALSIAQIKSALLALLISGGMLIPGNIPNIIAAHKLKITSREWALIGLPLGLVLLTVTWVLLVVGLL